MDAITDMDQVGEKRSVEIIHHKSEKDVRKVRKSSKIFGMNNSDNGTDLSDAVLPDVHGQMYLWDISEEPNVVIRQSVLEEFLYKIFTHPSGVNKHIYDSICGYLSSFVSERFKKDVLLSLTLSGDVYRYEPPKFTGPASQEIWS